MWEGRDWEACTPYPEPRPASRMPLSAHIFEIISKTCYWVIALTHRRLFGDL